MAFVAPGQPLRAAVFYTPGKAKGGTAQAHELIMAAFEAKGLKAETVDLANLHRLGNRFVLSDPVTGAAREWKAPDVALMYHGAIAPENTAPMLDAIRGAGTRVINGRRAWETMTDKAIFARVMEAADVPTIPTIEVANRAGVERAYRAIKAKHGGPVVFKKPISTEGDDVYIVRNLKQLQRDVGSRMHELGGRMIAQPFVRSAVGDDLEPAIVQKIRDAVARMPASERAKLPADFPRGMNNDFRVMTVRQPDGTVDVNAVFHRLATSPDQPVNNVAKGSIAVKLDFGDLHPNDQQTLLRAVHAMPEGQIVGWDLIGPTGKRVVMEGNSGSGLPTETEGFVPEQVLAPYAQLARAEAMAARAERTGAAAKQLGIAAAGGIVGLPAGYGIGSALRS